MQRRHLLVLAISVLAVGTPLLYASPPPRQTARYSIRLVGTDLGAKCDAVDINNAGDVLGNTDYAGRVNSIFIDRGGKSRRLPMPGTSTYADALNDRGDVLCLSVAKERRGYLWHDGHATEIKMGMPRFWLRDVGNDGTVCYATIKMQNVRTRPQYFYYLWKDGKVTPIGINGSAVAPDGSVVGTRISRTLAGIVQQPCIWRGGRITPLPLPSGAKACQVWGVNGRGEIVGMYSRELPADLYGRACKWKNSRFVDLGSLGDNTVAMAINNKSQAVGYGFVRVRSEIGSKSLQRNSNIRSGPIQFAWGTPRVQHSQHAVLFENGKARDLNDLIPKDSGWMLVAARAINDRGQIVGTGTYQGRVRGFVLTPRR